MFIVLKTGAQYRQMSSSIIEPPPHHLQQKTANNHLNWQSPYNFSGEPNSAEACFSKSSSSSDGIIIIIIIANNNNNNNNKTGDCNISAKIKENVARLITQRQNI
jgi:hypothetical protein